MVTLISQRQHGRRVFEYWVSLRINFYQCPGPDIIQPVPNTTTRLEHVLTLALTVYHIARTAFYICVFNCIQIVEQLLLWTNLDNIHHPKKRIQEER